MCGARADANAGGEACSAQTKTLNPCSYITYAQPSPNEKCAFQEHSASTGEACRRGLQARRADAHLVKLDFGHLGAVGRHHAARVRKPHSFIYATMMPEPIYRRSARMLRVQRKHGRGLQAGRTNRQN